MRIILNKIYSTYLVLFIGLLFVEISVSKAAAPADTTQQLEALFSDYSEADPGAVLVISRNGKEIFSKTFGYANLETRTKIDSETIFEAGSVSKQFTATAILLLVQEGEISLSDDVRKYIPELSDYGEVITIRHLLTHTSGLKDWRNIAYITGWPTSTRVYTQDFALNLICKQSSLNFKPGDQYRYSNSGYDLLGLIIERVSGESFGRFIRDNLLGPAGMENSAIRSGYMDVVRHKASAYLKREDDYLQGHILGETYGAAGLQTTTWDLQKWNTYINGNEIGEEIKKMRLDRMVLNDGSTITYANGGVHVQSINGYREISHGGLISGYRTWLAFYPELGLSVSYMSNNRDISRTNIVKKIRELFLGNEEEDFSDVEKTSLPESQFKGIPGVYEKLKDNSTYVRIRLEEGKLVNNGTEVKAIAPDTLLIGNTKAVYKNDQLTLRTTNGWDAYKKKDPFSPDAGELETFTGDFYSTDCDVGFEISVEDGQLISARSDYDSITLTPLYRDKNSVTFRGTDNRLRVLYHFTLANSGKVSSLAISLPRAANIPFTKR